MRVDERLNVATMTVDFSDDRSVFEAVNFILSNSVSGNAGDPLTTGSQILTTKVRMIKTLMDYAKHLSTSPEGLAGRDKGSLGDAKRFVESKMSFILNGNNYGKF